MARSFEARVNERLGSELGQRVVVAVRAGVEGGDGPPFSWFLVGGLAGVVLELMVDRGPRWLYLGLTLGATLALWSVLSYRRAMASPSQPGGSTVVLALTDAELVVCELSPLRGRFGRIAARVSFADIVAVHRAVRPRRDATSFVLANGERWSYVVGKGTKFYEALERLR